MKVVSVVGARPQFIKCAALSAELRRKCREVLVHTGQHYDENMSDVFFAELEIPSPDYNLAVGPGSHGSQTARMLERIEKVLLYERPEYVLVYGDTNSTLAGALAAAKLHLPLAHVEAGLRSFNRLMPEEVNRVVTDHVSTLLFCPTKTAAENLSREGINEGVHVVGDVMHEVLARSVPIAQRRSKVLEELRLEVGRYTVVTVHRFENTDHPQNLRHIFSALLSLADAGDTVVFPVHPRTRKRLGPRQTAGHLLLMIEPLPYFDMLILEKNAKLIITDSGGVQKEAYWFRVPCVTSRQETEWTETVISGWNQLCRAKPKSILQAVKRALPGSSTAPDLERKTAARTIAAILHANLSGRRATA